MARINPVSPNQAEGKTKELFDRVKAKMGKVPNILKTMGHAPAVLESYLAFSGALSQGALNPALREKIALLTAKENNCEYCTAAHSAIGKMAGLNEADIKEAQRAVSADKKTEAALKFAQKLVREKASVADSDINAIRQAGFTDEEIIEIVGNVSLNIFTNYFNHVADPIIDFPKN